MKIGLIGSGKHGARLRKIIGDRAEIVPFDYHTESLEKVKSESDGIIIATPSYAHERYLAALHDFDGHVLCEKPLCQTALELATLRSLDLRRTMFSFPLRHSLKKHIELSVDCADVISAHAEVTHGFAFKPDFLKSWRSDVRAQPLGPLEAASIHFIDLFLLLFGSPRTVSNWVSNISQRGTAPDDAFTTMFHDKCLSRIHASYAGREQTLLSLVDKTGRSFELRDSQLMFEEGMADVIDMFLRHCRDGQEFDVADRDAALESTAVMLA